MEKIEERVRGYWTKRAEDFSTVRRMELEDEISERWINEIKKKLPERKKLRILDVGTGTGYFAILLAEQGYDLVGVDLTPAMIEEAKKLANEKQLDIQFLVMDAQNLEFPDESFDVVIARNLTWTLPEPKQAYLEWMRVLVKGGILLNFDADYGQQVLCMEKKGTPDNLNQSGFHIGMTQELKEESNQITKAMEISKKKRPEWDISVLEELGFLNTQCDKEAGNRILRERNGKDSPTFLITVQK
ncbi:class I SAM-dependent methyltransferase [Anaerosacchariphilus polymeriproducens]|uniref:Class I SAM-dependent methyltransferase n=1 Tax=Anaerosacchariphilus polymeriproducens TaxID=1812858 RepID=A0A371AZG7_9FIRM|nr:class I SAM-dependent methyltransferase [Anaerosacchariphilus polymeriproducens]RDU24943.1 class I SAM-dependent methyltransferase [Anaerosacchariphilus polymeriproducens]